jgi:hypothetical protein
MFKTKDRTLLSRITTALLTRRRKRAVHFLHIRKTGGSAVAHALQGNAKTDRFKIRLHGHDVRLRDIPEGEAVVFFLRDPISRFVSGFYSRKRQGLPKQLMPWTPEEKTAFAYFETPNQLALALSSADLEEKGRAQRAMQGISHVRHSYWEWFESEEYVTARGGDIFFIGFQETLDRDFSRLKEKLGLSEAVSLPNDDVNAHRNPKGVDKRLDEQAVANLRKWYRDDYRFVALCEKIIEEKGFCS